MKNICHRVYIVDEQAHNNCVGMTHLNEIKQIRERFDQDIVMAKDLLELDGVRIEYLGSKGLIKDHFNKLKMITEIEENEWSLRN